MTIQTTVFDAAEYLDSDDAIQAYLAAALETSDSAFIAEALGTIARAKGMTQIAQAAGLSRESLYKSLSSGGNPEFATVLRVIQALGLRLSVATAAGKEAQ
jgi:probable addiction module antidote protein